MWSWWHKCNSTCYKYNLILNESQFVCVGFVLCVCDFNTCEKGKNQIESNQISSVRSPQVTVCMLRGLPSKIHMESCCSFYHVILLQIVCKVWRKFCGKRNGKKPIRRRAHWHLVTQYASWCVAASNRSLIETLRRLRARMCVSAWASECVCVCVDTRVQRAIVS